MDWFYAANGQQAGPVSDAQLEHLARTGVITAETLVWHQGLEQWKPYASTRTTVPATVLPPVIDQVRCAECNRPFSRNDVLRYENLFVCGECKPFFFQRVREGVGLAGIGAWRSGQLLVVRPDSSLPDRCVKCNAATNGRRIIRSLNWHPSWIYLLLFTGVLPYLIVATVMSKKAKVAIGLCQQHHSIRNRDVLIGWLCFVIFIGFLFLSAWFNNGWFALSGLGVFLAGLIYAIVRTPMVTPKRIDDHHVWLKGAAPEFISPLPEFPGNP